MAGPLRDPGPQAQQALRDATAGAGPAAADRPGADPAGGPTAGSLVDPSPEPEQPVEPLADAPVDEIEDWSLDQLHRRASEVGLEGRWDMSRDELVAALRDA